jgi:xanthine dehydrogenase accessory factor
MNRFIRELCGLLEAGREVVLAAVVGHAGSTPRSSGARMAILADGGSRGSVGGGLLEANVLALALELFARGGAMLREFCLTDDQADSLGMACGGCLTVYLEHLPAGGESLELYAALAGELEAGRAGVLVTDLDGPDQALAVRAKRLLPGDARADAAATSPSRPRLTRTAGGLRLSEPFAPPYNLHIAGAGHVALFTARLAALAGFCVHVLDDRAAYANPERFPEAFRVRVLDGFDACFEAGLGPADFVAILTRGHRHDTAVLARALATRAGYVGMIGSRQKREAAYAALLAQGFSRADLARVHCPIGLAIGAQTPEEIAVSIVAELIQARAGLSRERPRP